jgi:hypothetical protein
MAKKTIRNLHTLFTQLIDWNLVFCRVAGDGRCAGEGELVFGRTHFGRMMSEEDQGVKLPVLPVF